MDIEIKCKLGYTKSPITLFTCAPERKSENALDYLFKKYHFSKNGKNIFYANIYHHDNRKVYDNEFRLNVDYYSGKIFLDLYNDEQFVESICYWSFKRLETKLKVKLNKLAVVTAYPYRRKEGIFYKYVKLDTYKLKGFFEFLKLIEQNIINVEIYLKEGVDQNGKLKVTTRNVYFIIKKENLEKLFTKLH